MFCNIGAKLSSNMLTIQIPVDEDKFMLFLLFNVVLI